MNAREWTSVCLWHGVGVKQVFCMERRSVVSRIWMTASLAATVPQKVLMNEIITTLALLAVSAVSAFYKARIEFANPSR